MTSPDRTDRGPDDQLPTNTAPFQNLDPFHDGDNGANSRSGSYSEPPGHEESRSSDDDVTKVGDEKSQAEYIEDKPKPERKIRFGGGSQDVPLEKFETVQDLQLEHTPTAVEKIKSALADKFHLHSIHASGPSKIFNPTTVRARIHLKDGHAGEGQHHDLSLLWRSRNNRKGRNSTVVPTASLEKPRTWGEYRPRLRTKVKEIGKGTRHMIFSFPYWDMAFWSGWSYTIGSALFTICGGFAWSEVAYPYTVFGLEDSIAVPITFFVGAVFYQIGAVMAYLEAVNDGSFHGSAMKRLLEGHEDDQKRMLDEKIHHFFGHLVPHVHKHRDEERALSVQQSVDPELGWKTKNTRQRPGSIYPTGMAPAPRRGGVDHGEAEEGETTTYWSWRWYPSYHILRTHHVYEIGFVACAIQLFGVTLYGVTAIEVWPGIIDTYTETQELWAYWVFQVIAAACFLIASIMFMFETQEKWWKPELKTVGWWIGFWSTIGSVGFELCAVFGIIDLLTGQDWADYQSELSSMWGSFAYLVGSVLQWYEAVNKNPVAEIFNESGPMKSYQVHLP